MLSSSSISPLNLGLKSFTGRTPRCVGTIFALNAGRRCTYLELSDDAVEYLLIAHPIQLRTSRGRTDSIAARTRLSGQTRYPKAADIALRIRS